MTPSARVRRGRAGGRTRGASKCALICRLVRDIHQRWTRTRVTFRGDGRCADPRQSNGARPNRVDYCLRPPRSKPLAKKIDEAAEAVRTERAVSNGPSCAAIRNTPQGRILEPRAARRRPHRSHPLGSTPALSSPTSNTARRNGFTTPSLRARAGPENLVRLLQTQLAPIKPGAVPPSATRFASFSARRPFRLNAPPFATQSPNRAISPTLSSRPCGCG